MMIATIAAEAIAVVTLPDVHTIDEKAEVYRYASQRIFVVRREDYVYLVPFVEDEHTCS